MSFDTYVTMFHCKLECFFIFWFRIWEVLTIATLQLLVVLLLKYGGCWAGVLKHCGLWKKIFCGTGPWDWLYPELTFAWICQKYFPNLSLRNSMQWFSENSIWLLCLCQCFTKFCIIFCLLQQQLILLCSRQCFF